MSRFERRLEKSLEDPQHRAAYFAADAEAKLIQAINAARTSLEVSQRELGDRLGKSQAAVSQFFTSEDRITVSRLVEYLIGLGLAADVVIKRAESDGPPVDVLLNIPRRRENVLGSTHSRLLEVVRKNPATRAGFGKRRTTTSSEAAVPTDAPAA